MTRLLDKDGDLGGTTGRGLEGPAAAPPPNLSFIALTETGPSSASDGSISLDPASGSLSDGLPWPAVSETSCGSRGDLDGPSSPTFEDQDGLVGRDAPADAPGTFWPRNSGIV